MAALETLPSLPFGIVIANGLSPRDVTRLSGCSRTLHARRLELLRLLPLATRHAALADAVTHRAPEDVRLLLSACATRAMVTANHAHLLRMCCEHDGLPVLRSLHEQGLVEKADLLWTRQLPAMSEEEREVEFEGMRLSMRAWEYDQDDHRGCFPLLGAAAAGDVGVLRFLTTAFGLSNADYEGHTGRQAPLRAACFHDHVEVARYILAELGYCHRGVDGDLYEPGWSATPSPAILCAVRTGNRKLVELLIEHQQLTAEDFRIDFEDGNGGNNIGMLLREAGDADVEFLLWLLRRAGMTAQDLLGESPLEGGHILIQFLDDEDHRAALPRWLEAVRATKADVVMLMRELVGWDYLLEPLFSLGGVTAADVMAGGEDSVAVRAALNGAKAMETLMAPPFSLPCSAFRAGNCAVLRRAARNPSDDTLTRLLGLSRDILEEEVRDAELELEGWVPSDGFNFMCAEGSLAAARRALEAWDAGERESAPPLFTAADKPLALAEVRAGLLERSAFSDFKLRSLRLLTRRLGVTRDDLDADGVPALLVMMATDLRGHGTVVAATAFVREGLLRPEDARERAAELLRATLADEYGPTPCALRALFGPLGLTAEHALLPLAEGDVPGAYLRRLAHGYISLEALEFVLTSVGLSKEDITASGCLEVAQDSEDFTAAERVALVQRVLGE